MGITIRDFNPFSNQGAIELFKKAVSPENKLKIRVATFFAALVTFPLFGIGGVALFRALTRKYSVIRLDGNSQTGSSGGKVDPSTGNVGTPSVHSSAGKTNRYINKRSPANVDNSVVDDKDLLAGQQLYQITNYSGLDITKISATWIYSYYHDHHDASESERRNACGISIISGVSKEKPLKSGATLNLNLTDILPISLNYLGKNVEIDGLVELKLEFGSSGKSGVVSFNPTNEVTIGKISDCPHS